MGRRPFGAGFFSAMRTYSPKPRDIERRWYVIDASGAVLGRLSTEVAAILRGKHKPMFAPHMDTGDHVIVVNAKEVRLTGGKEEKKIAYRHSGYPGGLTEVKYGRLLSERPAYAVEKAIRGMLPKNRLGRAMAKKLQVYAGPEHPHRAQKPQSLRLGEVPRWEGLPEPAVPTTVKTPDGPPAAKRRAAKRPTSPSAKPATAKKTTAKRTTAKRTTAKRPTAARTTAKASTAGASTAKAPTAKRTTSRRAKKEE
jgi:large subunit ribosomal protein L13